jgi:hypothetical protein
MSLGYTKTAKCPKRTPTAQIAAICATGAFWTTAVRRCNVRRRQCAIGQTKGLAFRRSYESQRQARKDARWCVFASSAVWADRRHLAHGRVRGGHEKKPGRCSSLRASPTERLRQRHHQRAVDHAVSYRPSETNRHSRHPIRGSRPCTGD